MDRNKVDVENVVDEIWPEKLKPQKCIETLLTLTRLTLFFSPASISFLLFEASGGIRGMREASDFESEIEREKAIDSSAKGKLSHSSSNVF